MPFRSFFAATTNAATLEPAPINPEWILDGAPQARSWEWTRCSDGSTSAVVWDCTAGRFRWYFGGDEIVHIVEGEVTIEAPDIPALMLREGDVAIFHAGSWATWTVPNYVRKHAICRQPLPPVISIPVNLFRRVSAGALARTKKFAEMPRSWR